MTVAHGTPAPPLNFTPQRFLGILAPSPTPRKGLRVLTRPKAPWIYYLICWLAALSLLAHIVFTDWKLLKPTDIGGTLMGGMNGLVLNGGWLMAVTGLLLTLILRAPGSVFACVGAGVSTLGIGSFCYLNYPDNADQLIYSVSPDEIGRAMLTGAGFVALGLFLRPRFKTTALPPRPLLIGQIVVALLIALLFVGLPIKNALQKPLPSCAFDKQGHQLSICLGNDRVIVD